MKLVYYDDQSNPSTVPGIYTKLLDVDKVDLVLGGYATNMIAPAMPVVMQKGKIFIGLFGLAVNTEFKYPKYFAMIPTGPEAEAGVHRGLLRGRAAQNPKPQTVALAAADAEFALNCLRRRARKRQEVRLQDRLRQDLSAGDDRLCADRARVQAANPDLFVVCSYPLDSVGMVKAVNEIGFKPKMFGGAMVGLQTTVFKSKLKDSSTVSSTTRPGCRPRR